MSSTESDLPIPYGGRLVNRELSETEQKHFLEDDPDKMETITPSLDEIYDVEKICTGAYSPLEGFMGKEQFESVTSQSKLLNELPWTMPIVLAPNGERNARTISKIRESENAILLDQLGNRIAVLNVEEKFPFDSKVKKEYAQKIYATTDSAHPNVADIYALGEVALGGKIKLINRLDLPSRRFEFTPMETREEFERRGWKNVAAYQGRNPPHMAHEYIQRVTLERDDVDGIFIQPVVGKLKKGDYKPEVVMQAYEAYVQNYYPKDRYVLGSLSISMRYGGPKAVLFYAIVRRNFGCNRYIVGRDQAGVGKYYDPYACQKIFDEYDVGVLPLKYKETFFCKACGMMASSKTCGHPEEEHVSTSQTRIRKALAEGGELPKEILRPEVARVLGRGDVLLT